MKITLLGAGAWDAYVQDVTMKGGRPGIILTVLCPPGIEAKLAELIFRETTTLGIRTDRKSRYILPRESITVTVADREVSVKVARLGQEIVTMAPEYRDCLQVSETTGMPLKEIYDRARIAARSVLGIG